MNNQELYEQITKSIIEQLDQGIIPWERPWFGTIDGPTSGASGKPYSLLNQMLLGKPGMYYTFAECIKLKAHVRKGSKAKTIVFFKPIAVKDRLTDEDKVIPYLQYSKVFHESLIDDLPVKPAKPAPVLTVMEKHEQGLALIDSYIARETVSFTERESNRTCYSPSRDAIVVPLRTQFLTLEGFLGTAYHEMVHSTGHESRLKREVENTHGDTKYAKEELVAEFGAAYLMHSLGLNVDKTDRNTVAYIQSWSAKLRDNPLLFSQAASKAARAVEYIQGTAHAVEVSNTAEAA